MITNEQIAKRAYELWEKSGRANGHDLEHWLQAENDVRRQTTLTPRAQTLSTPASPMIKMPKVRKAIGR